MPQNYFESFLCFLFIRRKLGRRDGLPEVGEDRRRSGRDRRLATRDLGGGVARVKANYALNNNGRSFLNDSDTGFAWQALAGVRAPLNDHWDVGLKYRFFNANGVDLVDAQLRRLHRIGGAASGGALGAGPGRSPGLWSGLFRARGIYPGRSIPVFPAQSHS